MKRCAEMDRLEQADTEIAALHDEIAGLEAELATLKGNHEALRRISNTFERAADKAYEQIEKLEAENKMLRKVARRNNPSGCVCEFAEDGSTIESYCKAHGEIMERLEAEVGRLKTKQFLGEQGIKGFKAWSMRRIDDAEDRANRLAVIAYTLAAETEQHTLTQRALDKTLEDFVTMKDRAKKLEAENIDLNWLVDQLTVRAEKEEAENERLRAALDGLSKEHDGRSTDACSPTGLSYPDGEG